MPRKKPTTVRSRLKRGILGGVTAATTFTIISLVPQVTRVELNLGVIALGMLGGMAVPLVCLHAWRRLFSTDS